MLAEKLAIICDKSVKKDIDYLDARNKIFEKVNLLQADPNRGKRLKGPLKGFSAFRIPLENTAGRVVYYHLINKNIILIGAVDRRDKVYSKANRKKDAINKTLSLIDKLNVTSI